MNEVAPALFLYQPLHCCQTVSVPRFNINIWLFS